MKYLLAILMFAPTIAFAQAPTSYTVAAGTTNDTFCVGGAIASYSQPAPYNAERYFSAKSATCTFPIAPGTYTVTLREMENYWTASGKRVFSASVNGVPIFTNLDLFADAGGQNKADDKSVVVTVSSGSLVLTLSASVDTPKYNGITITSVAAPPPPPPPPPTATTVSIDNVSYVVNPSGLSTPPMCTSDDTACTLEVQVCDETNVCIHLAPGATHALSIKLVANKSTGPVSTIGASASLSVSTK